MLNAGYKKEALEECNRECQKYKGEYDSLVKVNTELYEDKKMAVKILKDVDEYVHSLSNYPKEIMGKAIAILIRRKAFEKEVEQIEIEAKNAEKQGKSFAGAGILTGAGVAAFGPTVAMSLATTFGTASTGTAIATLTGAAQTNAALALLGGGTVLEGGFGIVGGEAFLAMAGPVGWAIGGAALIGGGLLANSKNKKIAKKAEEQTKEIKNETIKLKELSEKIKAEIKVIKPLNNGVRNTFSELKSNGKLDYTSFTDDEKEALREMMNSANALSKRLEVKLS